MYELVVWLTVTPICFIVIPNIIVGYERFCDWTDKLAERRRYRKQLKAEYEEWYYKAISCDDAMEKGKAIAMLVIINHELEETKKSA